MHLPVSFRISGSYSLRNNSFISSFRFLRASLPFQRRMTSSQAAVVRSEGILNEIHLFNQFALSLAWRIPPWSSSRPSSTVLGLMQRVAKHLLLPVRHPQICSYETADFALQTPPIMRCSETYQRWGLPKRLVLSKLQPRLLWDGAKPQPRFGPLPDISIQFNSKPNKCS